MIDVWMKRHFSKVGSGDFVEITLDSMENGAILLGNESIYGKWRYVVYKEDVDRLIEVLQELKEEL